VRFLADMGVSLHVTEHLRGAGHDIAHLRDEGLQRLPDDEIFAKAIAERRIVLTFDLDFGEIAARCTDTWTSVIVFRLANATSPHVIQRLDATLPRLGEALEKDAVVVIEESRVRIRHLPIQPTE
jgi:predicted nuclease of predicted toxin-antitoxin system